MRCVSLDVRHTDDTREIRHVVQYSAIGSSRSPTFFVLLLFYFIILTVNTKRTIRLWRCSSWLGNLLSILFYSSGQSTPGESMNFWQVFKNVWHVQYIPNWMFNFTGISVSLCKKNLNKNLSWTMSKKIL